MKTLLAVLSVLAFFTASAHSATVLYNTEFSGGDPSGGTLVGNFVNTTDGVLMTLDASALNSGEFVSGLYLNSKANEMDITGVTYDSTISGDGVDWSFLSGVDAFKADGDGNFDYQFVFNPSSGNRFEAGEVSSWLLAGIQLTDLAALSVDGPVGKTGFLSAIHLQGIGDANANSGWYSAGTSIVPFDTQLNPVPIPAAAWMFLGGLGLFRVLRGEKA